MVTVVMVTVGVLYLCLVVVYASAGTKAGGRIGRYQKTETTAPRMWGPTPLKNSTNIKSNLDMGYIHGPQHTQGCGPGSGETRRCRTAGGEGQAEQRLSEPKPKGPIDVDTESDTRKRRATQHLISRWAESHFSLEPSRCGRVRRRWVASCQDAGHPSMRPMPGITSAVLWHSRWALLNEPPIPLAVLSPWSARRGSGRVFAASASPIVLTSVSRRRGELRRGGCLLSGRVRRWGLGRGRE